jgi:hypothetical protein
MMKMEEHIILKILLQPMLGQNPVRIGGRKMKYLEVMQYLERDWTWSIPVYHKALWRSGKILYMRKCRPKKDVIGSTFRAKVVDSSKGVWSSCKGTRNGDVYVFKNKGEGLWETDGGVPECPFYESFYWR